MLNKRVKNDEQDIYFLLIPTKDDIMNSDININQEEKKNR